MSGVGEVRALLAAFAPSPWRELYLRTDGWTVFLAKPGGGANPLRAAVATAPTETQLVTAPHLGTFTTQRTRGSRIGAADVIGTLTVLDSAEEIVAPVAGTLVDLPADGALVEYGAPLAAIAV